MQAASGEAKRSLTDEIVEILEVLWVNANVRALATSTGADDSVGGTVKIDRIVLAGEVKKRATDGLADAYPQVAAATVSEIVRRMKYAIKRADPGDSAQPE